MTRQVGAVSKKLRRATASSAAKRTGGDDPLAPLDRAGDSCFWCGEQRKTQLRVGRLPNFGYGTYCTACGKDGAGKEERGR